MTPDTPDTADLAPQRILIVRPSALGDVARTVPALVSLKRAFPTAQIDWLVRDTFADVVAAHPDLHQVVPFPRGRFRRFARSLDVTRQVLAYMRDLKQRGYDRVYDLQGLLRSGWLTWATRSRQRIGPADAREFAWLAYTRRISIRPEVRHTVDRMLAVLEATGAPVVRDLRLYTAAADRARVAQMLEQAGLNDRPLAVIAPTAQWRSKCWPIDRFDAAIERLADVGIDACVIVGSSGEQAATAALTAAGSPRRVRRVSLVGQTSVGELMAVIERSALVLANDSAALHIAVGLGRRAVAVFGPTDPARVGPYRYDIAVVRGDEADASHYRDTRTDQRVMQTICVERVWEAIKRVREAEPPNPAGHDAPGRAGGD